MGAHHVSLQIDENNNVTKVGHDMGGSYEIKEAVQLELFPNDIYEDCILCGEKTTTLKTTHIDFRTGYIEGAGQLCRECYLGEDRNLITINSRTILDTPNDAELGAKVRQVYWDSKHN